MTDCLDKNFKGKADGKYLITPDAEEMAHQKRLRDARNKMQQYETSGASRMCPKPVTINGKITNYVMAPC